MKLDHLFEQDRAHKSKACARCGELSARHPSRLEHDFDEYVQRAGLDVGMVKEFEFAKRIGRNWRADRAWPEVRIMVELDGGAFMAHGKHTTAHERARDNFAALDGWLVLRFDERLMRAGIAPHHLAAALLIRYKGAAMRAALRPEMFPPPADMKALLKAARKSARNRTTPELN